MIGNYNLQLTLIEKKTVESRSEIIPQTFASFSEKYTLPGEDDSLCLWCLEVADKTVEDAWATSCVWEIKQLLRSGMSTSLCHMIYSHRFKTLQELR